MARVPLREWQRKALFQWEQASHKGIVSVVTGGGKTIFALACIDKLQPNTVLIVVPTVALLDQWWEEAANYFDLALDEIYIVEKVKRLRTGTINLAVLNTASKLENKVDSSPCFLIVDECHKAASPTFSSVLLLPKIASLGLSATPERPYDDGLNETLIPALGPLIYKYTYRDALQDGVIVPFTLNNIVFELEEDRKQEYDRLTKSIARSIQRYGIEAQETVSLLLRRTRVLNLSLNRVRLALRLVAAHRGKRVLVFHEDIEACNIIYQVLEKYNFKAGIYHSKLTLRQRVSMLSLYRRGEIEILVTCRALDEGFNVPETEIGIIAASTATRRQRIQRLGRVLRPAGGKSAAIIYTLVATIPEISRLRDEEIELQGMATITWNEA
ncbi:DEAD/DEAH box helicase [Gloeobacter kilaueensis]|uniref:Type III restriction protein res subunit n=1 Tax=Gloeobacter kilaueensis (strain ATCC BAA-2537 / CCAP 1431/1 / ULC 316 / JS1) TaxID=1183438 RepID=U5QSS4_GLOK1|nr:DEAD/DEAH box helicase [Gloeobacter kilaueensis]AGY60724.1 type III restriction protein res subunit [Gloeobacter kilaueensis JS1]